MVASKKHHPLTLMELYESLPEGTKAEILEGSLVVSPSPTPRHNAAIGAIYRRLASGFMDDEGGGGPGGWFFLFEPALHLGEEVLEPDLAGWKAERLPELPERAFITVAPDWVCEVLSPKTAKRDREQKLPLYAQHRVKHAWLVDPEKHTLEAFKRAGQAMKPLGTWRGKAKVRVEPFEAAELDLGRLWR